MATVAGVLLAAGAGRRYGMPKALAGDGQWLRGSVAALAGGGCDPVLVVLGAQAQRARRLLPAGTTAVTARDWAQGMGASLRAGLSALETDVDAALVHLVDLPDVGSAVVARVARAATPSALARASFDGRPGHPVLLGREHWAAVLSSLSGDRGAREWLAGRGDLVAVECSDLATGADRDHG